MDQAEELWALFGLGEMEWPDGLTILVVRDHQGEANARARGIVSQSPVRADAAQRDTSEVQKSVAVEHEPGRLVSKKPWWRLF